MRELPVENREQNLVVVLAVERSLPTQRFIEDTPHRPYVDPMIDVDLAASLLGRHVEGSAEDRSHSGGPRRGINTRDAGICHLQDFGDTEVEQLDHLRSIIGATDDEDVLRFQAR